MSHSKGNNRTISNILWLSRCIKLWVYKKHLKTGIGESKPVSDPGSDGEGRIGDCQRRRKTRSWHLVREEILACIVVSSISPLGVSLFTVIIKQLWSFAIWLSDILSFACSMKFEYQDLFLAIVKVLWGSSRRGGCGEKDMVGQTYFGTTVAAMWSPLLQHHTPFLGGQAFAGQKGD